MLGTTLPTPLYRDLEQRFGFGELATTVVFAVYPLGVTMALLVCDRWSDQVGRRPMLPVDTRADVIRTGPDDDRDV